MSHQHQEAIELTVDFESNYDASLRIGRTIRFSVRAYGAEVSMLEAENALDAMKNPHHGVGAILETMGRALQQLDREPSKPV